MSNRSSSPSQYLPGAMLGDPFFIRVWLPCWDSNREVDWFVSNRGPCLSEPWQINLAISDHIPLSIDFLGIEKIRKHGRLKQQPKWHKPPCLSTTEWRSLLQQEWVRSSSSSATQRCWKNQCLTCNVNGMSS